jgi:paraquat-inducible protein B
VAGAIAAWLAVTTLREQGPTVSITLDTTRRMS